MNFGTIAGVVQPAASKVDNMVLWKDAQLDPLGKDKYFPATGGRMVLGDFLNQSICT
jgi:hypothetical protein